MAWNRTKYEQDHAAALRDYWEVMRKEWRRTPQEKREDTAWIEAQTIWMALATLRGAAEAMTAGFLEDIERFRMDLADDQRRVAIRNALANVIEDTTFRQGRRLIENTSKRIGSGDIDDVWDDISGEDRAEAAGITDTTGHRSAATVLAAIAIGIDLVWRTEMDDRVCKVCDPLNGTGPDTWRHQFPAGPPAHPRCRCDLEQDGEAPKKRREPKPPEPKPPNKLPRGVRKEVDRIIETGIQRAEKATGNFVLRPRVEVIVEKGVYLGKWPGSAYPGEFTKPAKTVTAKAPKPVKAKVTPPKLVVMKKPAATMDAVTKAKLPKGDPLGDVQARIKRAMEKSQEKPKAETKFAAISGRGAVSDRLNMIAPAKELLDRQHTGKDSEELRHYTGIGYMQINRYAKGKTKDFTADEMAEAKRNIEAIDKVIDSAPPLPEDIIVYRGNAKTHKQLKGKAGGSIELEGYVSTSLSARVAHAFGERKSIMEIRVPAGTKAVTGSYGEDEIVFGRGHTIDIVGVRIEMVDGLKTTIYEGVLR